MSATRRQVRQPIDRMSETEIRSKLPASDRTLAEIEHAFSNNKPTVFTKEDYDKMKLANVQMRKRLDVILEARLSGSLAGMSVQPQTPPNGSSSLSGKHNDVAQRRRSEGMARRTSGPIRSPIQPEPSPKVSILGDQHSLQIQANSIAADREVMEAGIASLPSRKAEPKERKMARRPPHVGAYMPSGAFDVDSDADDWMYEDEESEYELELPELLRQQQEAERSSDAGSESEYGQLDNVIRIDMEKMADLEARASERQSAMQA